MPTNKEIFDEKMNDLADSINTKAGTTGAKTIDQMRTTVEGIASVPEYPTEDGTYKLIATIDEGEGSMSWEEETPPSPSQYYAVTFMNGDTVFEIQVVPSGGDATIPSGTPYKEGDASHTYVFVGWNGSLTNITVPTTIQAVFMDLGAYTSIPTPVVYTARCARENPTDTNWDAGAGEAFLSTATTSRVSVNVAGGNPQPPTNSWIFSMVEIPNTSQNLIGVGLNAEFTLTLVNSGNNIHTSADVLEFINEHCGAVWFRKSDGDQANIATLTTPFIKSLTRDVSDTNVFHFTAEFIMMFDEEVASSDLTAGVYTGWNFQKAWTTETYWRELSLTTAIVSASYIPITQPT